MSTNNVDNNTGQCPIGGTVGYNSSYTPSVPTNYLNCDGSSISKTTYSQLYSVTDNANEGTGSLTQVTSLLGVQDKGTYTTRWHPSSNYIACGSEITSKQVFVASFNGSTLTEVATVNESSRVFGIDWHPNGNYLAAALYEGKAIKVYSWNGTNTLTEVASVSRTESMLFVAWHPNGNYLATTSLTGASDELEIYSWNGTNSLTSVSTVSFGHDGRNVAWSPDGNYLAVGVNVANSQLKIYSWNGTNTLTHVCDYDYGATATDNSIEWSLDGKFIAFGGNNDVKQLVILSFDGSALTERTTIDYGTSLIAFVRWSKGGNYLSVVLGLTTSTVNTVFLYSWVPSTYTLNQVSVLQLVKNGSYSVDFNYTNNYIAYSGYAPQVTPGYKLYAGTTGLTSCDYRTNFPLPTISNTVIRYQ